jgi:hypothetical protein
MPSKSLVHHHHCTQQRELRQGRRDSDIVISGHHISEYVLEANVCAECESHFDSLSHLENVSGLSTSIISMLTHV